MRKLMDLNYYEYREKVPMEVYLKSNKLKQ
jgi:hypothetical protein